MGKLPPFMPAAEGEGYFKDSSMIRAVNSELAVAFSGGRALLLQAAHPVMFEGFYQDSAIEQDIHGRLARTARVMTIIYYGPRTEADRWTQAVQKMHQKVKGTLKEDAGSFAAGTPYAADDPKYLLWTLASLWDSASLFFELYVRALSDKEQADLWQDYRLVGELFGLMPDQMPADYLQAKQYMRQMIEGGELLVTERAKQAGRKVVLKPPVPFWFAPLVAAVNFAVIGSLPQNVRQGFGFHWPIGAGLVRDIGAEATRQQIKLLPDALTKSPVAGGKLLPMD